MGFIQHHIIVVVSDNYGALEKLWKDAKILFTNVSSIMLIGRNDFCSFFIPPDGSKEGWPDSKKGDISRNLFVKALEREPVDYVEVTFGGDYGKKEIVR